jgi:hypothetical protein
MRLGFSFCLSAFSAFLQFELDQVDYESPLMAACWDCRKALHWPPSPHSAVVADAYNINTVKLCVGSKRKSKPTLKASNSRI